MTKRPYVLASCAMTVDGFIDDASARRLLLSNDEDFDRVDSVRASADAILVGANTIRQDDPRLLIRSEARVSERVALGKPPHPVKVTLTHSGFLDADRKFFTAGQALKLVYCPPPAEVKLREAVRHQATIVALDPLGLPPILADLADRGIARLMVEGGTTVLTQFLSAGLVDELHLAVCPFFVGDADAPRFVGPGRFPWDKDHRMNLAEVRQMGDGVLLRYLLDTDRRWLQAAIDLAHRCPPSDTAFSVGTVIVADGREIAQGFSRESDPHVHAEEAALAKLQPDDPRLARATLYSSLEPCSERRSRPLTCSQLIRAAGIGRVVFSMREPDVFVDCHGAEQLAAAGIEVLDIPELAPAVRTVNAHLLRSHETTE
ncbi:MAG TPA: dihydrofolate reductase family protein [Actinomycetota bacterium]|nr:dihydrofolate reductase family protein [Actinomycetota bacterium]